MIVTEFLDEQKLHYTSSGVDELTLDVCPYCGKEGHFNIHREEGLWKCFKCLRTGNLWTLRRHITDIDPVRPVSEMLKEEGDFQQVGDLEVENYQKALDSFALDYLFNRGITRKSIKQFRLGVKLEGMSSWLTIPYIQDGVVVNIKHRTLPPAEKDFRVLANHATPLFNIDSLDAAKDVFVTEGELDAITLIQHGYHNTVSVPLGAGSFSSEHFDALVPCGRINLVFDNDEPGLKGARDIADRLGPERCFLVKLPVKDANDFFQTFSKADFAALVEESHPVGRSSVLTIADAFQDFEERRLPENAGDVVHFPWKNVDKMMGPLQSGWLIVLQAVPFIGKSTFALNALLEIAKRGLPALFFCLEMGAYQLTERLISSVRHVPTAEISEADILMAKAEIGKVPLYLGLSTGSMDRKRIFETIRYSVKRFGIRILAFDHLHFLCRSIENITSEVGHVIREFKLLLEELKIPGIIITHPRKMSLNEVPGMYASRDSSEIAGDADVVMSLFRRPCQDDVVDDGDFQDSTAPTFEAKTLVRIAASRYVPGGSAVLYFNGDAMRFEEFS